MYKIVVVGTDGSPTAAEAVRHAAQIAAMCGASVHVVSAYKTGAVLQSIASASGVPLPADAYRLSETAENEAKTRLEGVKKQLVADNGGMTVETHAVPGDPSDAIIDLAVAKGADLIVVGNKGMSGAKRFVLGSVPNRVTHNAPCHVLIVSTA
jgi:nucleotide-binding universal stress UspA family protein